MCNQTPSTPPTNRRKLCIREMDQLCMEISISFLNYASSKACRNSCLVRHDDVLWRCSPVFTHHNIMMMRTRTENENRHRLSRSCVWISKEWMNDTNSVPIYAKRHGESAVVENPIICNRQGCVYRRWREDIGDENAKCRLKRRILQVFSPW